VTWTGNINFDGTPLPTDAADLRRLRRSKIALVRQGDPAALDPSRTVRQLLPDALPELGLDPDHFVSQLTAADVHLLFIGMAIARQPQLLILDEPFIPLDAVAEKAVVDLLSRQQNMALLLITHDLPAAAALVEQVIVLSGESGTETGPATEVFSRPRQDFSKHFIASGRSRARTLMRSPIGTELLEVHDISMCYPDRLRIFRRHPAVIALDGVSFTLRRGEALALVGTAGSGKSTLARLIAGLGRARKGVLAYERQAYRGRDLPRHLRAEISLVFPDPRKAFSPLMNLGASITEPLALDEVHTIEEQSDRLMDVLQGVGLGAEVLDLYPRDLGLYDLQLLALARALIIRPKLVVLDEPVKLLNARQRVAMLTLINRLRADFGFTAIITSSSLELIRQVADRALILDKGRVVDEGAPGALLEAPGHPATQALADARLPAVGIGVVAPVGR
jgi:ABC-type glutathione transport system ATPase component